LEAQAVGILSSSGLSRADGIAWTELVPEVARRTQAARRHAAITNDLMPPLERDRLSDEMVKLLQQSVEAFRAQIGEPSPDPEVRVQTLAELEIAARDSRARLEQLRIESRELRRRVEDGQARYEREHPEKSSERETCEQARVRACRFKEAIELSRETISQVAHETHRRWADFLNDRVSQMLSRVGTGVEQVRFGEDLDFAITPRRGKQSARGKAVRQLSSGSRDQLHLAVRLAISEYLSREEALPLLIDDCFITSDDERARAGMKLLLDQVSREHQVILVTCHRKRFESLAAMDAELYRDRVHWMDVAHLRNAEAEQRASI
jgi:DNA repair exonuclease SbcCD ATPase subunit